MGWTLVGPSTLSLCQAWVSETVLCMKLILGYWLEGCRCATSWCVFDSTLDLPQLRHIYLTTKIYGLVLINLYILLLNYAIMIDGYTSINKSYSFIVFS